jgi:hypothetical protein
VDIGFAPKPVFNGNTPRGGIRRGFFQPGIQGWEGEFSLPVHTLLRSMGIGAGGVSFFF